MHRPRTILWASLALTVSSLPALAQTPPARIGNIYDGTAHEPSAPAVQSNEKAAGIAPPPAEANKEDQTIKEIDKQLLGNKDNLPPPSTPSR